LITSVSAVFGQDRYQPIRASWVDDGLVIGGTSHEPFIFRVRKGGMRYEDARKAWLAEHDEALVIECKNAGEEVFHTHGYKGFGYEAEREDMEMLKELSALVHAHGMRLDVYCQVMTIVPETFFAEEPRAVEWIQRDALGSPIMLTYGYQQSYRFKPNLAHPEYREYYKEKVLRTLVQECDADLLHFDNFDLNMEPESDHSPVNVAYFRDYLRRKYSQKELLERFGHVNVHLIDPPRWNLRHDPQKIKVIQDPVQQEWIDYRCWLMADWLKEMSQFVRALKPEVAIDTNPHGLFGVNRAFNAGLWHPWFMKHTEITWSEEPNYADYTDDGLLVSKIRSYKMGRTLDNYMLSYTSSERMQAEKLAFNQTIGNTSLRKGGANYALNRKYFDFYQAHRELYTRTRNREDAALLRSYPTMAYDNHRAALEQCMFEQAMIQGHVPFDIIFDEQMSDLSGYRVLVLAGQNNLSDEHLERIRRFVATGGGLVVTGLTSQFDKWGRRRSEPGLSDLLGIDGYWVSGRMAGKGFADGIKTSHDGRVIYVPEIVAPDRTQAETWKGSWDGHLVRGTWIKPVNWRELVWAVRQAAGGRFRVELGLPDWVAVEQVEKGELLILHLVNYRQGNKVQNIPVDLELDTERSPTGIELMSPDFEGIRDLDFEMNGRRCRFVIPELQIYDMVVIRSSS